MALPSGGHEPGNFGLFHIAMERGKLHMMNPMHIPVYEWVDGVAVRRPLVGFTRTPLRTFYLQQPGKEPLWHLCNEPFDYSKVSESKLSIPEKPSTRVLNEHYPNANNPQLAIEFSIPEKGWVLVEILDQNGKNLEVALFGKEQSSVQLRKVADKVTAVNSRLLKGCWK